MHFADLGQEVPAAEQRTVRWLTEFQKAEVDKWVPLVRAAKIKTDWRLVERFSGLRLALEALPADDAFCGTKNSRNRNRRPLTEVLDRERL